MYKMNSILASVKEGEIFTLGSSQFILVSHNTTYEDLSLCKIKGSNSHVYLARSSKVTDQRISRENGILPIQFPLLLEKNFNGHVLYLMDENYTYHMYVYHELDMQDKENFESLVKHRTMVYPNRSWKFYYYSDLDKMSKDFFCKSDKISLGISNLWYQINTYKKWNNLALLISVFIGIISLALFLANTFTPGISLNSMTTALSLISLSSTLCLICILTNYFANKFKEK